jgi:heat shock protein HslJ
MRPATAAATALAVLTGAFAVGGCTTPEGGAAGAGATKPAAPTGGNALRGVEWKVAEIGGAPIVANSQPTIQFEDGRVFGAASCNRFMGGYEIGEGVSIKLGQMASTMMACPDPLMAQETRFLELLGAVTSYSFDADGALVLAAPDGRTIKARRA